MCRVFRLLTMGRVRVVSVRAGGCLLCLAGFVHAAAAPTPETRPTTSPAVVQDPNTLTVVVEKRDARPVARFDGQSFDLTDAPQRKSMEKALADFCQNRLDAGADREQVNVLIRSGPAVRYAEVITVYQACLRANLRSIHFATKPQVNPNEVIIPLDRDDHPSDTRPAAAGDAPRSTLTLTLRQLAYEKEMLNAAGELQKLDLTAAQTDQIAAATATFRSELEAMHGRYKDELKQIDADTREARGAVSATGADASQVELLRIFRKHEGFYRDTLRIFRRYREGLMAALTPAQCVRWQAASLRGQLERRLQNVQLSAEQQAKFKTACEEAARQVLLLPEDRDQNAVQQILEVAWSRFRQESLTAEQRNQTGGFPN